ncbi:MAG: AI-2E family transporter [Thermovirga sp.]|nr:AI-2E family transporter [Thermovirga sp.]
MGNNRLSQFFLAILSVVAVGFVLKVAKGVILPLVVAWLLYFIFAPVVRMMARRKIPTFISTSVVLMVFIGVCFGGALFLNGRVQALVEAFPRYQTRFAELIVQYSQHLNLPKYVITSIDPGPIIGKYVFSLSTFFVGFVSNLILVVIFLIFLLSSAPYFERKVERAFSKKHSRKIIHLLHTIAVQIGRYLILQFLISAVTGLLVWLVLKGIGVDFSITWGALAFVLNFIPTVGSILASIPPIALSFVQFHPEIGPVVVTALSLFGIQQIIGNLIAPKIMGENLNLSPIVILLSLLFWGWLWGVTGAILSIPIASAIRIICENVDQLKFIGVLMGSSRYIEDSKN